MAKKSDLMHMIKVFVVSFSPLIQPLPINYRVRKYTRHKHARRKRQPRVKTKTLIHKVYQVPCTLAVIIHSLRKETWSHCFSFAAKTSNHFWGRWDTCRPRVPLGTLRVL